MERDQLKAAIAKAYAGGGGDAAQIVDEVESDLDLTRIMQEMPAVEDLLEAADDAPVIRMIIRYSRKLYVRAHPIFTLNHLSRYQ